MSILLQKGDRHACPFLSARKLHMLVHSPASGMTIHTECLIGPAGLRRMCIEDCFTGSCYDGSILLGAMPFHLEARATA